MQEKEDSLFIKLIPYIDKYGILLLIAIMLLVLHLLQPEVFFSWRNITNIFKQISWQSMLALGVFLVIVTFLVYIITSIFTKAFKISDIKLKY